MAEPNPNADLLPARERPRAPGSALERRAARWTVLLVVAALAATIRIYDLKDVPAGFYCDEAGNGYNAFSLLETGKDENGRPWPLYIWSFGVSYKNPAFIYAAMLPIKLLGLDEFSVRLTSALFGIATVVAIFYLGRALFSPWVGLFSALLLAVCPWHIHFSRIAFELIAFPLPFVIGFTLLARFVQGRRTLPLSFFFFSTCIYTYAIAALFVPLFLIGFGLLYLPTLARRRAQTLLALLVAAATVAPAAVFHYQQRRGDYYFRNTTSLQFDRPWRDNAQIVLDNYRHFFSRSFLFEHGDPLVRHAVRGKGEFGELLPFFLPFVLLGAAVALGYPDRASKLLLWWLALYPLGASLMNEIPSATRSFIGAPAFCLLAALGLGAALKALGWVLRLRPLALGAQTVALAAAGYFLVPEVARYLREYFVEYPKYSAPGTGGFQFGYRDTFAAMEPLRGQYDQLMLTATDVNQPQIFALFYNRLSLEGRNGRFDVGYQIADPSYYSEYSIRKKILYQLRPQDTLYFDDYDVKKRIVTPGGEEEFVIAEVRSRRRYLTNWLVLGPFDSPDNAGVRRDLIDPRRLPRGPVAGISGPIAWRPIALRNVRVDFNAAYATADPRHVGNPEWACAYAVTIVRSPQPQRAYLEMAGTPDPFEAWLNGTSLTPALGELGEAPIRRPIDLRAGDNALLVKSCESVGDWDFMARIAAADGRDLPGLSARAELPDDALLSGTAEDAVPVQVVEGFEEIVRYKHHDPTYEEYRDRSEAWRTFVRDPNAEIAWRTAPVAEKKDTFAVFTYHSSHEAGVVEVAVNGRRVLDFTIGRERGVRRFQDGDYQLALLHRGDQGGANGVAVLRVPATDVTPGRPLELRLAPRGNDPNAWVMVHARRDTLAHERLGAPALNALFAAQWEPAPFAKR